MEAEGGTKNGLRMEAGGGSQDGGDGCKSGGILCKITKGVGTPSKQLSNPSKQLSKNTELSYCQELALKSHRYVFTLRKVPVLSYLVSSCYNTEKIDSKNGDEDCAGAKDEVEGEANEAGAIELG